MKRSAIPKLAVTSLEDRLTPAIIPQFAVGSDAGVPSQVKLFNPDRTEFITVPSFQGFTGGTRVASADFDGDGVPDIAIGSGPGMPSSVQVYSGKNNQLLFITGPFEESFTGGVFVAAGDIDGDGFPELIVTPDQGGGPRVRIYDPIQLAPGVPMTTQPRLIADFFGIDDPAFRGGARAAVGDVDGDGVGDLIVAAGFGGGPRIAVYDGLRLTNTGGPKLFSDFFVFEDTLRNGVYPAAGDLNGDGFAEVIAGGGPGGGPRVFALDGLSLLGSTQIPVANFFAGNPDDRGGVRVSVKDLDGDDRADLVTGQGTGSQVNGYLGNSIATTPTPLFSFVALESNGAFVG